MDHPLFRSVGGGWGLGIIRIAWCITWVFYSCTIIINTWHLASKQQAEDQHEQSQEAFHMLI